MTRCFDIPLKFRYGGLYAVVVRTDDYLYNKDCAELLLFESKEEYDEYISNSKDIQVYTGEDWCTLYKKET